MTKLFEPIPGSGVQLGADTTSDTVALGGNSPGGEFQVSVFNTSTSVDVFVDFGTSAITTTATTGHPVPFGQVRGFTLSNPDKTPITHMAAITSTSTATVHVNRGHGI